MCTVTFIPTPDGVHFSSNRDERKDRKAASAPIYDMTPSGQLLFPRDGEAGGTWITLHGNGTAAVLLNGAFEAHRHDPPYRQSRGLVMLQVAGTGSPVQAFRGIDLQGIEPFTLIVHKKGELVDCRWDGQRKHILSPDPDIPHIWSSCTLYDAAMRDDRKKWFRAFLEGRPTPSTAEVWDFHMKGGGGDPRTDLLMNRDDLLGTVSITSMFMTERTGLMQYLDLRNGPPSVREIHFDQTTS